MLIVVAMVDCQWLYSGNDKSWQEVVISNASGNSDRMLTKENGDGGNEGHWRLWYSVVVMAYG